MGVRRYALISGVDVVNIVLWDSSDPYEAPAGLELRLAPESVGPGWRRIDNAWVAPPAADPVPLPEPDGPALAALEAAAAELKSLGMSETAARMIVGLPA